LADYGVLRERGDRIYNGDGEGMDEIIRVGRLVEMNLLY